MEEEKLQHWYQNYNLDEQKVNKMVERAVRACVDYVDGKLTLKQVWYRCRGERFLVAVQLYPDDRLGMMLYELAQDFFTDLDVNDKIIEQSIMRVAQRFRSKGCRFAH